MCLILLILLFSLPLILLVLINLEKNIITIAKKTIDLIWRLKLKIIVVVVIVIVIINISFVVVNIIYVIINKFFKKYYYRWKKVVLRSHLSWAWPQPMN